MEQGRKECRRQDINGQEGGVLKGGKWEKWGKFLTNKDAYYFAIKKGLKAGRWSSKL